jgi:L-threonylcarbamoyladenylate synthase
MHRKPIHRLPDTDAGIEEAALLLKRGALVAFPTETVYGVAADARNDAAVAAIYRAKDRPAKNPLIVHAADIDAVRELVELSPEGDALAQAFWPGPLTLVAPAKSGTGISPAVRAGHSTLAIRVPAHPVANRLLVRSGLALAAPSANRSGRVSPTTADHVIAELGDRIPAVIDGGQCSVGVESTIVGLDGPPTLLRPGGIPLSVIEACLGLPLEKSLEAQTAPTAPGQLASHYAPSAQIRLNANSARPGEVLLGFGAVDGAALNLSPGADLTEAATNLFAFLRDLDSSGVARIAVSPIPEVGLGYAINDRLRRAAAPRDQSGPTS